MTKAIKITRVNDTELGISPTGYLLENGCLYDYDGMEILSTRDGQARFYDEDGILFEETTINGLLEYWEQYSEAI